MVTSFDKNMYQNYMIIEDIYEDIYSYQEEMLSNNQIEGLLPFEIRQYNNKKKYCYNITGLHEIQTVLEKKNLDKILLESLAKQVIYSIKNIHDYLLDENDIVLLPNQIFIKSNKMEVKLCYCPGYSQDIMSQVSLLFEFLMNKVEYSDKEAVILVYSLYMKSRDKDCKINELLSILNNGEEKINNELIKAADKDQVMDYQKRESYDKPVSDIKSEAYNIGGNTINHNKDSDITKSDKMKYEYIETETETETETEVLYYPLKSYILIAASLAASTLLFYITYRLGIIKQSFGQRIDSTKTGILLMFLVIINLLIAYMLFNKNKKQSKMRLIITDNLYYDHNKSNRYHANDKNSDNEVITEYKYNEEAIQINEADNMKDALQINDNIEDDNIDDTVVLQDNVNSEETVLLRDNRDTCTAKLQPEDEHNYRAIYITETPYYIGKLNYNTNSCIPKPTISKIHAKISKEEDGYIITDLNSTNGTYINGIRLPVNGSSKINNSDKIAFADVEYTFVYNI